MKIARHITVMGRVQGVFFRAWMRDQANELGVAGWVRNCPDGSVEAHLEGGEAGIRELVEKMRQGPSGAQVDNLEVSDAAVEDVDSFDVRH